MNASRGKRQVREVEIGFLGRVHNGAIWVGDADGIGGDAFINYSSGHGAKVCRANGVGDCYGVGWDDSGREGGLLKLKRNYNR